MATAMAAKCSTVVICQTSQVLSPERSSRVDFVVPGQAGGGLRVSPDCAQLQRPQNNSVSERRRAFAVTSEATETKTPKTPAETEWKIKRQALLRAKVRSVTPKEALRLQQEQGYTIIDVRPEFEFKEAHPAGAVNIQIYRLIKEWTAWDIARRAAFAFFGILQGTEENPDFINEVALQLSKDSPMLLTCHMGGTMRASSAANLGKESRSLIAAYLLTLEGYTNVVHVEGGLRTWFKDELPTETLVVD